MFISLLLVPTATAQSDPSLATGNAEEVLAAELVANGRAFLEELGYDDLTIDTVLRAVTEAATSALTIPEMPPADGVEWAQLYLRGSGEALNLAWGATVWRLVEVGGVPTVEGILSIPALGTTASVTLRPGPADDLNAFLVEATINTPPEFGMPRSSVALFTAERFLIDNVRIADTSNVHDNTILFALPLSGAIEITLAEADALTLSLAFADYPEANLTLSLGETGHNVLEQAIALWSDDPAPWIADNAWAGLVADIADPIENAYLFELGDEGMERFVGELAWQAEAPDRISASVSVPDRNLTIVIVFETNLLDAAMTDIAVALFTPGASRGEGPGIDYAGLRLLRSLSSAPETLFADFLFHQADYATLGLWPEARVDNLQRLADAEWFVIELARPDGRREVILLAKDEIGAGLFGDALDIWGAAAN